MTRCDGERFKAETCGGTTNQTPPETRHFALANFGAHTAFSRANGTPAKLA